MSLRYMLDTDICIYITRQENVGLRKKLDTLLLHEVSMSTVTYGELYYGIQRSKYKKKTLSLLEMLTGLVTPLPLPAVCGHYYGEIRAKLESLGTPIGNNDMWIAAHALSLDIILVTNNTKEFSRVPNLKLENWISK